MVSCTASSLPILGKGTVERAIKARRRRPMFMVDLAVPRDIEPEVAEMDDVFLYTVDDLGQMVKTGVDARQSAVAQAEAIIETSVGTFLHWLSSRDVVPTIRALRSHAEEARGEEVQRALKLLARGDDPKQVLEALSHGLTNKLMHAPTQALNNASAEERARLAELVTRLYQVRAARASWPRTRHRRHEAFYCLETGAARAPPGRAHASSVRRRRGARHG